MEPPPFCYCNDFLRRLGAGLLLLTFYEQFFAHLFFGEICGEKERALKLGKRERDLFQEEPETQQTGDVIMMSVRIPRESTRLDGKLSGSSR